MRQASKRWVRVAISAPCGKPRRREGRGSLPRPSEYGLWVILTHPLKRGSSCPSTRRFRSCRPRPIFEARVMPPKNGLGLNHLGHAEQIQPEWSHCRGESQRDHARTNQSTPRSSDSSLAGGCEGCAACSSVLDLVTCWTFVMNAFWRFLRDTESS